MEVEERRKRIAELKAKREALLQSDEQKNQDGDKKPKIIFRNYIPSDQEMKKDIAPLPIIPKQATFDEEIKQIKEQKKDDNLLNFVAKKPDWDLKRNIQSRLDILEKRTQKVIVQMLKEKIAEMGEDGENVDDEQIDEEEIDNKDETNDENETKEDETND
ncbi:hypothetical protein WA158_000386 [Blastocystis sp. Blastoise]